MYDKSQLNRGILEGCILRVIKEEEIYGYDILKKLLEYGFEDISEGTIYPLLLRLEKKEYIVSEKKPSPLGPKRKYYTITNLGNEILLKFEEQWDKISSIVYKIFNKGEIE